MPDNLGFCFPTAKFRSGQGPEFGEVELIAFPFVIKGCQKLAVQRQMANLRTASADVEHAVSKFFPSDGAGEVVGGEPDPRTGKIFSPVLVSVPIAGFRGNKVSLSTPNHLAQLGGFHPLRMVLGIFHKDTTTCLGLA